MSKQKKYRCDKFYYLAENTQNDYLKILVESREGIDQTNEKFKEIKKIVKVGIEKSHSFTLIIHNNPDLDIAERTLYNYQYREILGISNINLPQKYRYKKRKRNVSKSNKERSENSCK